VPAEGTANKNIGKDNPIFLHGPLFDFFLKFVIMKPYQKGGLPIEDDTQQLRRFSTPPVFLDIGNSRDREDSEDKTQ